MKKLLAMILAFCMMVVCFAGCSDKEDKVEKASFSDVEDMEEYLTDKYWACDVITEQEARYTFLWYEDEEMCIVEFTRGADQSLDEMLDELFAGLTEEDTEIAGLSDLMIASDGGRVFTDSVTLDPENGTATSLDTTITTVTYEFFDDDTMVYNGDKYAMYEEWDSLELISAFDNALSRYKAKKKQAFMDKYENAVSYKDVRYSPYSYLGSTFLIEGTAELDDYFNYDYRDMEMLYFCIAVTPTGGGYTDIWYIYADQYQHKDLLEKLKNGSISNITIAAHGYYPDSLKNGMATLRDYCVG